MKVVTRGKKPFASSPLLRLCLGMTLAGLGLTMNSMVRPNGLSFTLFSVVGTPLMLGSVALLLYLFLDDMRKRHALFSIEEYQPGEVIIAQGDSADRAYFIQRGEVEVVREGRQVAKMGPGDYFGEMALLRPDARRTATVAALTQVELMVLGKENFYRLLDAIPALRLEFMGPAAERRRTGELRDGEESG